MVRDWLGHAFVKIIGTEADSNAKKNSTLRTQGTGKCRAYECNLQPAVSRIAQVRHLAKLSKILTFADKILSPGW